MSTTRRSCSAVLAISAVFLVATAQIAIAGGAGRTAAVGPTNVINGPVLPPIRIVTARSGIAPGVLFATPTPAFGTSPAWVGGPTIYDNAGHVIWYLPNANVHVTLPVTYKGKPALAYHLTTGFAGGWTVGHWVIVNQSYQQVGTIGNNVDHHELLTVNNGTMAYVDSYHPVKYDLSKFGGPVNGTVVEAVIQEINLNTNKVVYEWHSLPHIPVTETNQSLKDNQVDYFHINSIAVDTDGNLIVSGRHLSAVLKINRQTGAVMWQLGGKQSTFTFTNGSGPSFQHDARIVGKNTYSVFDNGVSRSPQYSRAVIYKVDPVKKTASIVGEWRHSPDLFSGIEGDTRQLPNGNRIVGWAVPGITTEYAGHSVVFESRIDGGTSYRTIRSAWKATPSNPPAIIVHRSGVNVTADVSWNGATDVARWELLGGPDSQHLRVLRTVPYTGFAMSQTMSVAGSDRVFSVRAVRQGSPTFQSSVVNAS
jgi:hypothetical protein